MADMMVWSPSDAGSGSVGAAPLQVFESVYVTFKNSTGLVDVTNPRVSVRRNGELVSLKTMGVSETVPGSKNYPLTRIALGNYRFVFYVEGLTSGLHDIQFEGEDGDLTLKISGKFEVGVVTREFDLIRRLREQLEDVDPSLYQIISKTSKAWSDANLLVYLQDTLNDLNQSPPTSLYLFGNFPYESLLLLGAKSQALFAASVKETWDTMQYNDELSLVINRAPQFQALAKDAQQLYETRKDRWKQWIGLYGDNGSGTGIGMGTQTIPFQISRVLSWLPNMQNTFGL